MKKKSNFKKLHKHKFRSYNFQLKFLKAKSNFYFYLKITNILPFIIPSLESLVYGEASISI